MVSRIRVVLCMHNAHDYNDSHNYGCDLHTTSDSDSDSDSDPHYTLELGLGLGLGFGIGFGFGLLLTKVLRILRSKILRF